MIYSSRASGFGLVSCSLCSGTSGFGPGISGLFLGNSGFISRSSGSGSYRGLRCMGSGSLVWGGLVVSGGGEWGCGGDVGCSVMMVDGRV
jgi:hypothetical protein